MPPSEEPTEEQAQSLTRGSEESTSEGAEQQQSKEELEQDEEGSSGSGSGSALASTLSPAALRAKEQQERFRALRARAVSSFCEHIGRTY